MEPPLEEISDGRWSAPWGVRVQSRPAVDDEVTMMRTDRQAGIEEDMRIEDDGKDAPECFRICGLDEWSSPWEICGIWGIRRLHTRSFQPDGDLGAG